LPFGLQALGRLGGLLWLFLATGSVTLSMFFSCLCSISGPSETTAASGSSQAESLWQANLAVVGFVREQFVSELETKFWSARWAGTFKLSKHVWAAGLQARDFDSGLAVPLLASFSACSGVHEVSVVLT